MFLLIHPATLPLKPCLRVFIFRVGQKSEKKKKGSFLTLKKSNKNILKKNLKEKSSLEGSAPTPPFVIPRTILSFFLCSRIRSKKQGTKPKKKKKMEKKSV